MDTNEIKIGDVVEWTADGNTYRKVVTSQNLYAIQRKFNTAPKWMNLKWRIVK